MQTAMVGSPKMMAFATLNRQWRNEKRAALNEAKQKAAACERAGQYTLAETFRRTAKMLADNLSSEIA